MLSKKKLGNNLMLLIFSVMMSWNSFSQNVTDNQIQLTKPIARLVIKDLIQFDGLSNEMQVMQTILTETNNKLLTQGELVSNLQTQVQNYQSIIDKKNQQFDTQEQLSKKLQIQLTKSKLRTKIMGGAGLLVAVGVAVLVN